MAGRSIAPRPTIQSEDEVVSGPSVATHGILVEQGQPQMAVSTTTRKKVTNACQGCQKRRVRCDGGRPCATCLKSNIECLYVRELDGRSIKRKYYEVQRDQELLDELLETIRHTSDDHVAQIVSLIRSDAAMDDIKADISQQLTDIKLAGPERSLDTLQPAKAEDRARLSKKSDLLEIHRLTDRPVHRVTAAPWTSTTTDDDLVSHLISVWTTWDKGWYDWVDQDLFIRDMQAGSLDCMFCSPFLANSILAWACPYSDYKEARTNNDSISQLMLDFIAEAERLLEDLTNSGICLLTTVQGLVLLHGALSITGKDTTGYRYMLQSIGMARDLAMAPMPTKIAPDSQMAKDLSVCIDRTSWGVFISTTYVLTAILKPQFLTPPRRSRPQYDSDSPLGHLWKRYPDIGHAPVPSYRNELFDFGCELAIVEAELSRVLFDVEEQSTRAELEKKIFAVHRALSYKIEQLPPELNITTGCCPAIFYHHVRIQSVQLRMFLTLRQPDEDASPDTIQIARTWCTDAALEIARICKLYMDTWGAAAMGIVCGHPVFVAISVLVEEQEPDRHSSHITDMCVALRALSRRWPIAMAMMRMVQLEAREKGWKLPLETDKLFQDFERLAWNPRALKRYVTLYPVAEVTKTNNVTGDMIDVGNVLERMEEMDLDITGRKPGEWLH